MESEDAATLTGHTDLVRALAVFANADDGEPVLASASSDSTIKLWNLKTYESVATLTGHSGGVASLAVFANADDGELSLASGGGGGGVIMLWNLKTHQHAVTLTGHTDYVNALAVFANADDGELFLASGSDDRTIKLWNLKTHQNVATLTGDSSIPGDRAYVLSLAAFANVDDGELCLVSGSARDTVKLWSERAGAIHPAFFFAAAPTPNPAIARQP